MRAKKRKPKEAAPSAAGFTRRDFLKGAGAAVGTGLLVTEAPASPPPLGSEVTLGPGPVAFSLKVNGKLYKLNLEPRVTLLDALRNHLDLTGA